MLSHTVHHLQSASLYNYGSIPGIQPKKVTAKDIYISSSRDCTEDNLPSEELCCILSSKPTVPVVVIVHRITHTSPKFLPAHLFRTNTTVCYSLGKFFLTTQMGGIKNTDKKDG